MIYYGIIHFNVGGVAGARAQRFVIEQFKKAGITKITNKEIRAAYKEDCESLGGCIHRYVLYDDNQRKAFDKTMRSPELKLFPIKWRITTHLGKNNDFRKWLEEKGAYVDGRN